MPAFHLTIDPYQCFKDGDRRQKELARLVYPPKFEAPTLEAAFPCLQVTIEGQQLFDDVLMSALIVERKRLTPMEGKENKSLFN